MNFEFTCTDSITKHKTKARESEQLVNLAKQYEDYVKWQSERIKDWKPHALEAVK